MGSLSVKNASEKFSRLGTFNIGTLKVFLATLLLPPQQIAA
jgi:hypothetical protein